MVLVQAARVIIVGEVEVVVGPTVIHVHHLWCTRDTYDTTVRR